MFRTLLACFTVVWGLSSMADVRGDITQTGSVSFTSNGVLVGTPTGTGNDGTLRVTPPSTLTTGSLLIAQGGTSQPVNGSVFIQGGAANISQQLTVGVTANGLLSVTDGGVVDVASAIVLGDQATTQTSSRGTLVVDGPNSLLRYRSKFTIGNAGDADVSVTRGGGLVPSPQATSAEAVIGGNLGSVGVVTIDGAGSRWHNPGLITVGNAGAGTLRILNGGVVTSTAGRLGGSSPSETLIRGLGSRWTLDALTVASGEVRVEAGGTLDTSSASVRPPGVNVVGEGGASGFGRVVVSGPEARWYNPGALTIGRSGGAGELYLEAGTLFSSGTTNVGQGARGLVVVRGEQTRWQVAALSLGVDSGNGELRIEDGAEVSFGSNATSLLVGGSSRIVLDGGELTVAASRSGSGLVRNFGLVTGSGRVAASDFQNAGGTIRVEQGGILRLGNVASTEAGVIEVTDAELELSGVLSSTVGTSIYAAGATIRTGYEGRPGSTGFRNGGQTYFTGGDNRIFSNVENTRSMLLTGQSDATFYRSLTNSGAVKTSAGTTLTVLGAYRGNGVAGPGEVFLEGPVAPGTSLGKMDFGGDVTLGDLSALAIEVAGAGDPGAAFDQVNAVGTLALGGDLSIRALGELSQAVTLPIVTAAELVGKFGSTPALGAHLDYGVRFGGLTYDYAAGKVLASLLPTQQADFNLDGLVDGLDLLQWQADLGSTELEPGSGADANGDGAVTGADLAVWRAEFRSEPAFTLSAAAPEPRTAVLFAAGLGGFLVRRPLRLSL